MRGINKIDVNLQNGLFANAEKLLLQSEANSSRDSVEPS